MQIALDIRITPEITDMAYVLCDGVRVDTAIAADERAGIVVYVDLAAPVAQQPCYAEQRGTVEIVACRPFTRADLERLDIKV